MNAQGWRRTKLALPIALALLAACGNSTEDALPEDNAELETTPTITSPEQSTTVPASLSIGDTPGIVALVCSSGSSTFELRVISPESGEVIATSEFVTPASARPRFGCSARQGMFDRSFTRIAVDITGLPDGSSHVGFMDLAGNVTDVSEALSSGGFSAAPQHSNALFGSSGELLFVDNASEDEVILAVDPLQPVDPEVRGATGEDGFTVDEHGNARPFSGRLIPSFANPSGEVSVFQTS